MSQKKLSLFPEGTYQREPFLHPSQESAGGHRAVRKVFRAEVGHAVVFPVVPDELGGIEFQRIGRKSGQEDLSGVSGQEIPNLATTMNWQAIPDDKQQPTDLPPQMSQTVQDLRGTDRSGIQPKIEPPPSNASNGRQMLPVEVKLQLWGLSAGRPGPADMRTLGRSALVYENDGSALSESFFLRAGHLHRFQRRMAFSSRSTTFPEGRWQLHPRRRSTLQTWPGWYEMPQVSRIASATRGRVHRQLLYPWASGPSSRTRLIWFRCRALRRGFRPVRPLECSPATPFFFTARAQRDTDISLAPIWRATSAWLSPLRKSTAASFRRCSKARMALPSRFMPFEFPMQDKVAESEWNA